MLRHPYDLFRSITCVLRSLVKTVLAVLATLFAGLTPAVAPVISLPKVLAYRIIKRLKPVYRDSLDTHGLSLFNGSPG